MIVILTAAVFAKCSIKSLKSIKAWAFQLPFFLDNARYQRCLFVQEYAAMYGIELVFLPSYSPNLNLIERYWKFIKKQCLYSKYYEDFNQFKGAIQDCIDNAHIKHKDKLQSLLTWNFQSFKKCKILAA